MIWDVMAEAVDSRVDDVLRGRPFAGARTVERHSRMKWSKGGQAVRAGRQGGRVGIGMKWCSDRSGVAGVADVCSRHSVWME